MYYVCPPYYYVPNYPLPQVSFRQQYPEVDTTQFTESAEIFQELMKDAQKIINEFANSKEFAHKVMDAAQKSDHQRVKELIKTTGVTHPTEVDFNPSSIDVILTAKSSTDIDCCRLVMALHW